VQGVAQESGWSAGVRPEEKLSVLALCCPHWVSWHYTAPTAHYPSPAAGFSSTVGIGAGADSMMGGCSCAQCGGW
jgi:hypothetical protein